MTRLTAEFWVQAYLTRLRLMDIPGFVLRMVTTPPARFW